MPGTIIDDADEDTLRVLVSTDNHLGYNERHPVRGSDSFCAFEEVLYLAKKYKADMVLLAGDLFHDNKPSRRTLHKTMEILKRYTMGPDPVAIQILSENNFAHGDANYLQEYVSVDLPIFSIHGNHDDPTRDAGNELLAALDLLSVSSLVNYFGRQDVVDKVEISPVLLKKGDTQVALYGMGSLRDERLNRMWQSRKVRFQRSGEGDWFNIFALHQNRDLGRGSKNCVHESMIPEWMDLIVWGHEHECLIDPFESVVGTFRITQPGSSVATSLSTGESVRKHVGLLDIRGSQFRMTKVPLIQVRSFMMGDVSLSGHGLDPEDPKVDEKVGAFLSEEVKLLRHNAKEEYRQLLEDAKKEGNDRQEQDLECTLEQPEHCLVRLKVEHSGFTTLNNQRFGARFVGQVANPEDILLFHRKKETTAGGTKSKRKKRKTGALDNPVAPEDTEEMNIEDLIKDNLDQADDKLKIFDESKLNLALEEFVSKETVKALSEVTKKMLDKQQKTLLAKAVEEEEEEEEGMDAEMEEEEGEEEEEEEEEAPKPKKRCKKAPARKAAPARSKRKAPVVDLDDEEEDFAEEAAPPPRARAGRRTTKKAAVYTVDDDDEEEEESIPPKKKRAPAKASKSAKSSRSRNKRSAAESDDDEYGESFGVDNDWGEVSTNPVR